MELNELLKKIQYELTYIRYLEREINLDPRISDRIDCIQWTLNDFVNSEFKDREQDPFQ